MSGTLWAIPMWLAVLHSRTARFGLLNIPARLRPPSLCHGLHGEFGSTQAMVRLLVYPATLTWIERSMTWLTFGFHSVPAQQSVVASVAIFRPGGHEMASGSMARPTSRWPRTVLLDRPVPNHTGTPPHQFDLFTNGGGIHENRNNL